MRFLVRFGSVLAIILLSATGCSPQTTQPGVFSATAEAAEATKVYLPMIADGTPVPPATGGSIVYRLGERLYRVEAAEGAQPEELSLALDELAAGADAWGNLSADGEWLLLSTERFDPECSGWPCLALLRADLSSWEAVRAAGQAVHPEFGAVASGGDLIVYPDAGGPHAQDLWVISRSGEAWGSPLLLTADSAYEYNNQPGFSVDGSRIYFDCGVVPYSQEGTAICEVGTGGEDFRVVLTPEEGPGGSSQNALHSPRQAPDGSLVFESDWGDGELLWRLPAGGGTPALIRADLTNDNSPCVLPDGRIVSLWLNRPGNPAGVHEIKVMAADGSAYYMALIDADVMDIGVGCGGP